MKKQMFLGAYYLIFEQAKALRGNMTPAELILWSYLQQSPMGHKFRRQHPIDKYIADFYCHSLKLIIEVDGAIHENKEIQQKDIDRQNHLESFGIFFLRFTNHEVENHLETVIKTIEDYLKSRQNNFY